LKTHYGFDDTRHGYAQQTVEIVTLTAAAAHPDPNRMREVAPKVIPRSLQIPGNNFFEIRALGTRD
jgi:hypothetical protein